MKDNIDFFTHDTDAGTHPKFKALIAAFGFEGYGRFWRLNELIGKAPGCRLDIGRRLRFNSLADDLKTSPDELQKFLDFLCDDEECGLLQVVDNVLTTDRTQSDLSYAMKTREAAARRRTRASSDESETSGDESQTSGDRNHEGKEGREGREGRKEEGGSPGNFRTWLLDFLRNERHMRNPGQFAAKVMASPSQYPDLYEAYQAATARASPPPPPPERCDICAGEHVESDSSGTAECADCGRTWALIRGAWQALRNTGRAPPADDIEDDFDAAASG